MHENMSKSELEKIISEKNRGQLEKDGLGSLIVFNLENFAYRYLQLSSESEKNSAQIDGLHYWVERSEDDIVQALKEAGPQLKIALIELCKKYPGSQSKGIQLRYKIGARLLNESRVESYGSVSWKVGTKEDEIKKEEFFVFEDPLELRNCFAVELEKVCTIF
jgi:hypothetical protein